MSSLYSLLGFLIPSTFAAALDTIGTQGPGVSDMWDQIRNTFPHTNMGSGGALFVATRVIDFMLLLIGGAAVAVVIYGGITLIISRGSDDKIGEAKNMVLYALLGVILAMLADVIVFYVCAVLVPALAGGGAPPQCSLLF